MIKTVEIIGLNGKQDFCANFNEDLNILTGRNGSGKTTLLKLLWYMMSANRELILSEIRFKFAKLVTDLYEFSILNEGPSGDRRMHKATFRYKEHEGVELEKILYHEHGIPVDGNGDLTADLNRRADIRAEATVFFPTFRRIEGGFALEGMRRMSYGHSAARSLNDAVEEYSHAMSSRNHQFVASISTADIEELLTRKYADVSEKTNALYLDFSRFIMERLGVENTSDDSDTAVKFREDMRKRLDQVNQNRENLMRPFDKLTELISKVFKDKGITISQNLTFGQAKAAIRARILSAGEKQMFSFLSYNAFARDSVIFIDEPELSLHVDWQRILFKMLLEQGSSNQFIITTHSPFIYSSYPEKELPIVSDRGE